MAERVLRAGGCDRAGMMNPRSGSTARGSFCFLAFHDHNMSLAHPVPASNSYIPATFLRAGGRSVSVLDAGMDTVPVFGAGTGAGLAGGALLTPDWTAGAVFCAAGVLGARVPENWPAGADAAGCAAACKSLASGPTPASQV